VSLQTLRRPDADPPRRRGRPRGTPVLGRVRGRVLLLLSLMYALAYFDRVNISTAGPSIRADLGLSATQFGLAISAFSLPYALTQALGGWVGDRAGARRTLGLVGMVWGVATVLTGLVGGLVALVGARGLLGLSEGAAFPTATRAMAQWLPPDRRAFGQGVVHAASRLGNALAPIVVAALIAVMGWRGSFFAVGVLSVAWAAVWTVWFRDRPSDKASVSSVELEEMVYGDEPAAVDGGPVPVGRGQVPVRALARRIWPVTLVDFCYGWVLWVYLTWLPSYFGQSYGLPLAKYALFTSLTLAGGVLGDWLGGVFGDRLLRRTRDVGRARRTVMRLGLGGSAVAMLPALVVHSLVPATLSLALAFFFLELSNSAIWAVPMDVAPEYAGVASGMMNTGFGVAGILAPPVFGFLLDSTGGFEVPLAVSLVLLVGGVLAVRRVDPRPLDLTAAAPPPTQAGVGPDV